MKPMNINGIRRYFALLIVGLFVGVLGACGEQSSTEQTSAAPDEAASGTESTN
jgi:hypothetical protein